MGLINQLKEASSMKELGELLERGKKFDMVSGNTKRKWARIARRKMVEFKAPPAPEEPAEIEPKAEVEVPKKPKKKKVPYQKPKRS